MRFQLLLGDACAQLDRLAPGSVQCVITSPPYWGLRDYGVAAQIGIEDTPAAYVAALVEVFASVRRVLRDDGVLWLNLGDSYFGSGQDGTQCGAKRAPTPWKAKANRETVRRGHPDPRHGLKFKDLVGMPWRVALALQQPWLRCQACDAECPIGAWREMPEEWQEAGELRRCPRCQFTMEATGLRAGWYLRSDVIWAKPNPMPESVTDRPPKVHEYVFLLTKSDHYAYNAKAGPKRSVWPIATALYPDAHFATFPEALVEPCLLAGSQPGDLILDPFCGSGTVGVVALKGQRNFIGIDVNPEYLALARSRLGAVAPLFAVDVTEGAACRL